MAISDEAFTALRDKVNSVAQTQDDVVIPALTEIKSSIGKLAFVSQKDHDRDLRDVRQELKTAIEGLRDEMKPTVDQVAADTKLVNAGGLKVFNGLFGKVVGILGLALAIGIIVAIIFGVFTLYPAIKGTIE